MSVPVPQKEYDLEPLINNLKKCKSKIIQILSMLENQYSDHDWSKYLNLYGLLASEINAVINNIMTDRNLPLEVLLIVPVLLTQHYDNNLAQATEGRLKVFNHDVPAPYLRTRLDPKVKGARLEQKTKASSIINEVSKQSNSTKTIDTLVKDISQLRTNVDVKTSTKSVKNNEIQEMHDIFNCMVSGKLFRK